MCSTSTPASYSTSSGPDVPTVHLQPYDAALFDVLAADGRATTARLAEAAGISEGSAARRLASLFRTWTLVIGVDLAHHVFGLTVGAQVHVTVSQARLPEVGEALAQLPETGFVAAMWGRDNLLAAAACRDLSHLYEFTTGRVGAGRHRLDGGRTVHSHRQTVRRAGCR